VREGPKLALGYETLVRGGVPPNVKTGTRKWFKKTKYTLEGGYGLAASSCRCRRQKKGIERVVRPASLGQEPR